MPEWFPTLREQGVAVCAHDRHEVVREPLLGMSGPIIRKRLRCGWCGATYSARAARWIGGSLDWPQRIVCVPGATGPDDAYEPR